MAKELTEFANENKDIMYANRLIRNAVEYWMFNPDKTFLWVYKNYTCKQFAESFYQRSEKLNVTKGDLERAFLQGALHLNFTTVTAQIYSYAYENIFKNYNSLTQREKNVFASLKSNFLQGKNLNNDQILKLIRQAIAHNNDLASDPNYTYDLLSEKFTFHLKDNTDTIITISNEELMSIVALYINNIQTLAYEDYELEVHLNEAKKGYKNILHLRQKSTNKLITPDGEQLKVLQFLTDEINQGYITERQKVLLLYPFKNGTFANLLKLLDLQIVLLNLYKHRTKTFKEFMQMLQNNKTLSLSRFEHFVHSGDMLSLFDSNLLFHIFSTSTQDGMQNALNNVSRGIDINKVRNSIMHGTYFYNRDIDLVFYDEKKKEENILKYVGKISMSEITDFSFKFLKIKFSAGEVAAQK